MDIDRDCYYARPANLRRTKPTGSGRWIWSYAFISLVTVSAVVGAALSEVTAEQVATAAMLSAFGPAASVGGEVIGRVDGGAGLVPTASLRSDEAPEEQAPTF